MSRHMSLYWIARCDRCAEPLSTHAMSVLSEEMLCLACLIAEAAQIAALRGSGQSPVFHRDPGGERHPRRRGMAPGREPITVVPAPGGSALLQEVAP
jgi:hypothetical protein